MLVLVGLGNPGPEHSRNRHNVGFMAVDAIARRHAFGPEKVRFHGLLSEGSIEGEKVLALKPQTFMNESGRALGEALRFYKVELDRVVVFHDELDLAPGKLKAKRGGGLAGHNGLKSIDRHVGRDFRRVRIGIGHPGEKNKVTGYVLKDVPKAEVPAFERLFAAMADAAPHLVRGDDQGFMTKVALILNPPKPKAAKVQAAERADDTAPGAGDAGQAPAPEPEGLARLKAWFERRSVKTDGERKRGGA